MMLEAIGVIVTAWVIVALVGETLRQFLLEWRRYRVEQYREVHRDA
jgi:hypothetical protein